MVSITEALLYNIDFFTHMHIQCESMEWQNHWPSQTAGWPYTNLEPELFMVLLFGGGGITFCQKKLKNFVVSCFS